jgi:regulator of extracellular matrix RemA (YlzA/DUF370 family)
MSRALGLLNIGFETRIPGDFVMAIMDHKSANSRRLIEDAKQRNMFCDATAGKARKSIVWTKNCYVFLSAILPETLAKRFNELVKD